VDGFDLNSILKRGYNRKLLMIPVTSDDSGEKHRIHCQKYFK
jgi:hypothetical protein